MPLYILGRTEYIVNTFKKGRKKRKKKYNSFPYRGKISICIKNMNSKEGEREREREYFLEI